MTTAEERDRFVGTIRRFVDDEVVPVAGEMEYRQEYPFAIVDRFKDLGLFGMTTPKQYGGLGIDVTTCALTMVEISRGWMSAAGVLNSHLIMCYLVANNGTEEQKARLLPPMASGETRGGITITEPHAGNDVQAIKTTAVKRGSEYIINGTKMFVSNGRYGRVLALVAKTDPEAVPAHRGMSCFIIETGGAGYVVTRDIRKLGCRSVETVALAFEDFSCRADNLVGLKEGEGFKQIMGGLELGRVTVAARGLGIARAAFDAAIRYVQQRQTFGKPIGEHQAIQLKLADMYAGIEAARLLMMSAAEKKDRGERCDLETGMAKLFSTELAAKAAMESLRIHGGRGYSNEFPVERYYRDAPSMIIGEGTNEIQRMVIARQLLSKYKLQE